MSERNLIVDFVKEVGGDFSDLDGTGIRLLENLNPSVLKEALKDTAVKNAVLRSRNEGGEILKMRILAALKRAES